ncbi:MAG: acyl-CoA dehydrogenase family protein [Gammaproteobacteria bacterium]
MPLSHAELLGRAAELAPVFARRALETEQRRALPDATVRDLVDSELLSALTPAVYGGHELPIRTMTDVVRTLSAACPSTGWVTAFYMGAAWRMMGFPARAQQEIFAEHPYVLSAGQAAPLADVRKVPGGYRLSGQTAWSSGSVHAEWINFMGIARDDAAGTRTPTTFIVPRADTQFIDNWHVAGMRGTGSNDFRVDDVFVPDHRASPFRDLLVGKTAGQALHANPMYHLPLIPFLLCEVVPVVVGTLRGAAEAFIERAKERRSTFGGTQAATRQAMQMRVARGLAAADAAETLLEGYVDRYTTPRPEQDSLHDRAYMKLRGAYITDLCRNAVNDLARGFGADGFREHSPLQRYFRDLNMLAVHAFLDIDTASETFGRSVLGLPPEDPLL